MKIYIAAPLFSESERFFNEKVDAIVRECGHETFLPQREGGCVADLPAVIDGMPVRKYLFQLDCSHMDWCDAMLCGAPEVVLRNEDELREYMMKLKAEC